MAFKSTNNLIEFDSVAINGEGAKLLYFPKDCPLTVDDHTSAFKVYLDENSSSINYSEILKSKILAIDYKVLITNKNLQSNWPNFQIHLTNDTLYCLNCMSLAVHKTIWKKYSTQLREHYEKSLFCVKLQLINHLPQVSLNIAKRDQMFGKLLTIKGTISKTGPVLFKYKFVAFDCSVCNTAVQHVVEQNNSSATLIQPTRSCRGIRLQQNCNFTPFFSSPFTKTSYIQTVILQDVQNSEVLSLQCDIFEENLNTCKVGEDVILTGVMKLRHGSEIGSSVVSYLQVISVENASWKTSGLLFGAAHRELLSDFDVFNIMKVNSYQGLFKLLVQSLCPSVYGNELVKAGLILSLFGGQDLTDIRGSINILMVGDPGIGSRQLLGAVKKLSPRGVYVYGRNSNTNNKLSPFVTKENGDKHSLTAGPIVLADQGHCCIEDFDKIATNNTFLIESIEDQQIMFSSSDIKSTKLPTRTSIVATATPSGGSYKLEKNLHENVKIHESLLEKFDLVFVLLDQANEKTDFLLSEHVLSSYSKPKNRKIRNIGSVSGNTSTTSTQNEEFTKLKQRLMLHHGEAIDLINDELFRKYIIYAQTKMQPVLNNGAQLKLITFFNELRNQRSFSGQPISLGYLETLRRLTEARAKIDLRQVATGDDANDVIEIVKYSLIDVFPDEFGINVKSTRERGASGGKNKWFKKFLSCLDRKSQSLGRITFSTEELKELSVQIGLPRDLYYEMIETLNFQGFLLKKAGGEYKFISMG